METFILYGITILRVDYKELSSFNTDAETSAVWVCCDAPPPQAINIQDTLSDVSRNSKMLANYPLNNERQFREAHVAMRCLAYHRRLRHQHLRQTSCYHASLLYLRPSRIYI